MQFLAELVVFIDGRNIKVGSGEAVEIDRTCRSVFAVAGDGFDGQRVAQLVRNLESTAVCFDFLVHDVEAGTRVVRVVQHGCSAEGTRQQASALTGLAIVLHIIARKPHEQRATVEFQCAPTGPDVLVVIFRTEFEIVAKTAAGQTCTAGTDPEVFAQRGRGGNDEVGLVVRAIGASHLDLRFIGKAGSHIFDGTTNGVATVERALRPPQHLDPLDIVHIEHGSLGAIKIDIVDIKTDARLEAGDGILLPHAANERGECCVGAAADFQRKVRHLVGNFGDLERAAANQFLA